VYSISDKVRLNFWVTLT